MRNKLIELVMEFPLAYEVCDKVEKKECGDTPCCECLADHLLKNGVVVPPCKVGDSVYIIDSEDESCKPSVLSVMVTAIGYDIEGFWITMCLPSWLKMSPHCGERCFGKTVFLTKEEAVRAIKERES